MRWKGRRQSSNIEDRRGSSPGGLGGLGGVSFMSQLAGSLLAIVYALVTGFLVYTIIVKVFGFRLGEISCPTRYMPEASSINFRRSVKYGFGVLATSLAYWLHTRKIARSAIFAADGRTAQVGTANERGQIIMVE